MAASRGSRGAMSVPGLGSASMVGTGAARCGARAGGAPRSSSASGSSTARRSRVGRTGRRRGRVSPLASRQPISSALNVCTPRRSSTSGAMASLAPIRPVPRTHPMRGATIRVLRAPRLRLRAPDQHLERGLRLAVRSVAAERAVVGREREQDGERGPERADQPLDAEQLQPQLRSRSPRPPRRRSPVVRIAANGAISVGVNGSRRRSSRPWRPPPGVCEPVDECVDVGERRQVRGDDVQLRAGSGRGAVELAVEATPRGRVGRGRDDDRCSPRSRCRTSAAAIEPGEAPVTSAVSSRKSGEGERGDARCGGERVGSERVGGSGRAARLPRPPARRGRDSRSAAGEAACGARAVAGRRGVAARRRRAAPAPASPGGATVATRRRGSGAWAVMRSSSASSAVASIRPARSRGRR